MNTAKLNNELLENPKSQLDVQQVADEAIRELEKKQEEPCLRKLSAKYPEMFSFAAEVMLDMRNGYDVLVKAPVKSGKRIMTQICGSLAVKDKEEVIYHSAFWQKSMNEDMKEIKRHSVTVHKINTAARIDELIETIKNFLDKEKTIYLHFDESDHGTYKKGLYASFRKKLEHELSEEEMAKVRIAYITATPQEIMASSVFNMGKIKLHIYTPPKTYFGAQEFLANDLVKDCPEHLLAFDKGKKHWILSQEFLNILTEFFSAPNDKSISIIRGAKRIGSRKEKQAEHNKIKNSNLIQTMIKKVAEKCGVEVKLEFVDCEDKSNYSWKDKANEVKNSNIKHLVFINQMAKRSVNLECHKNLHTFVESRAEKSNFATKSQSAFRVVHYVDKVGDNNEIKVYCDKKIFELEAGQISEEEYLDSGSKLSARVVTKKNVFPISNEFVFGTMKEMTSAVGHMFQGQPKMFQKNKELTRHSVSKHSARDIAKEILDNSSLPLPVFIDGPNPNFVNSYVQLCQEKPHILGKYYFKHDISNNYDKKTYNSVYDEPFVNKKI